MRFLLINQEKQVNNNEDAAKALMHDIPRGVETRRLSEQTPPQARFLNPEDILQYEKIAYDPNNPGGKILLGAIGDHLVGIDDNRHVMTVAGSRAGKSVTLIGNLHFYQGSVICTDPKGELAEKTADKRAALGQKVCVLDPFHVVKGSASQYRASYNPLKQLTLDNPYIVEDALQITDGLVVTTGEEKDPHWNESASHFIMGIILYVALDPDLPEEKRNLITVRYCINHAMDIKVIPPEKDGDKEIRVYEFLSLAEGCADQLIERGNEDLAEVMMGAIKGFYQKGTEERGSVLSTVRRNTQFLDFASMKSVMSEHDFDLTDLKRDKISIYLVLPATRMDTCSRWFRLIINQLFDAMEREPTLPDIPVLCALDEFPVLGFMKQLQNAAGQIASFGVRLWIIMQDWGQGQALYKDRFESFAANAGILQVFGNVDVTTTEYISKRLGQTLVQDTTASEVSADQRITGLIGEHDQRQLFPLMTADELSRTFSRNDPQKRQLIFWAGVNPMILQRYEYYNSKN